MDGLKLRAPSSGRVRESERVLPATPQISQQESAKGNNQRWLRSAKRHRPAGQIYSLHRSLIELNSVIHFVTGLSARTQMHFFLLVFFSHWQVLICLKWWMERWPAQWASRPPECHCLPVLLSVKRFNRSFSPQPFCPCYQCVPPLRADSPALASIQDKHACCSWICVSVCYLLSLLVLSGYLPSPDNSHVFVLFFFSATITSGSGSCRQTTVQLVSNRSDIKLQAFATRTYILMKPQFH